VRAPDARKRDRVRARSAVVRLVTGRRSKYAVLLVFDLFAGALAS
jgi:hypothetical protein